MYVESISANNKAVPAYVQELLFLLSFDNITPKVYNLLTVKTAKGDFMIDFKPAKPTDMDLYNSFLSPSTKRGCEYNFANLILWGQQNIAVIGDCLVRLSYYGGHISYAFPIGCKDKEQALSTIINDAKNRGIPCNFFGVYEDDKNLLESLYPDKFRFIAARDSYDYVYDINDLADLSGRKFHAKRNHINRFKETYPDYTTEVITKDNIHLTKELAECWYKEKLAANPTSDFDMEQIALDRAIRFYEELKMEGILLKLNGEVLAFTMASRMSADMWDVNFEKAKAGFESAYPVINNEFAKHIRDKYPETKFLDREEDMGIEGLRKAKESYRPHHLVEKYAAKAQEDCDEDF